MLILDSKRALLGVLTSLALACRTPPEHEMSNPQIKQETNPVVDVIEEPKSRTQVIYVFDPYCGWCYGFSATIAEFEKRNAGEIELSVIPGGLFAGARRVRIGELTFVPAANARVTQLTGAKFGAAFDAVFDDGTLVLDSGEAARGFVALSGLIEGRRAELAAAIQSAFFMDGKSLSNPETFEVVGARFALEPAQVRAALSSVDDAAVTAQFSRARALGVSGYPAVLVQTQQGPQQLVRGYANLEQLEAAYRDATRQP